MIDKGKYASHGAMVRKLPNYGLAKWQKTKLAVINPLPSTIPRQKKNEFKQKKDDINVNSKTINSGFKFQQKIKFQPLQQDLIKPFLYIERVMKKLRVEDMDWKNVKPFVTSSQLRQSSSKNSKNNFAENMSQIPSGYMNLYEYEQDKRKTAKKLFTKLMNADVGNLKDFYLMWNKRMDVKDNPQIYIKESEFIDFIKELSNGSVGDKLIKHFFELYKNRQGHVIKRPVKKQNKDSKNDKKESTNNNNNDKDKTTQPKLPTAIEHGLGMLSIKSLSFNYEKFVKSEVQITNIMSPKALKQRYTWVKRYLTLFDQNYQQLKQGMNSIKQYEESLRQHFKAMYNSYKNPFQQQIIELKKQLQKPIIKYDKHKKDTILNKIQQLQTKNNQNYQRTTQDYEKFSQNFQSTIVKNHDLFFNKRIICKLVLPILNKTMYLNKELLSKQIQVQQQNKRLYIECLSNLVVEIDKDKKYLGEDCFTLADLVQAVLMKFNKKGNNDSKLGNKSMKKSFKQQQKFNQTDDLLTQLGQEFVLKSMKKLIKEIKKQYLLKNELFVQDIDQFPADQQIPMQLLHTCFEMQCTKVLAKNHIWSQLLILIPDVGVESKLHQQTITCNQTLGYLKKYFLKLDENACLQRNKSKHISLLVENATLDDLWYYNEIVEKVNRKMLNYNEDEQEQERQDEVIELDRPRKVGFADVAESFINKENLRVMTGGNSDRKQSSPYNHQQNVIATDILKAIFNDDNQQSSILKNQQKQSSSQSNFFNQQQNQYQQAQQRLNDIPESLSAIKTLSKSFMVPQKDKKLSTNAFDIRFYEKMKDKQSEDEEILRLGTSALLSHLPKPQELQVPQNDPLRISRYLQKSITQYTLEQQKQLQNKIYQSNVKQGVDTNYFRDKIKLQNRPTRYDSEGKSKYSVLFPVGYYEGIMANQDQAQNEKWYLRPHHVETLTENPLSKKDNLINTEYQSKLERIPLKKRPDEFVIQENVQRKDQLIQTLEERIQHLKANLENAQQSRKSDGQKVPTSILNKYLTGITEGKQDKDLEMAAYQAVLYDLRRNEKSLLVEHRQRKNQTQGEPQDKWWQKKDSSFNNQLRKDRLLVSDSMKTGSPHKQYVEKLKNKEIY